MANQISIENLSIGYTIKKAKLCIASDISVVINEPKLICLIGKNGVGKSTLLRTLSGVQAALSGRIKIEGMAISDYSNAELSKQIAIVSTERIPPNNLTVYELIALGRQTYTNWIGTLKPSDTTHIENALKLASISELRDKKVDELSDGQYQKVMIARALAQDTPIIILDEPTAHLDLDNKVAIFNLLQALTNTSNEHKKIIIISSHELQLVLQKATDLWLMTATEFIAGDKNELIKKGELSKMFDSNLISFDKDTKQFRFR